MNQQTAQGLAALGRGPDTMLVHMAPEEVAGLQALALKHGGTLTINPETGLAEAGFLKSILPMIAGFALGPAGFGLMSSVGAGLTVGGISALTSGSLEKGLMAGLGAYGGAGLGESLMGAGTGAMSSAAGAGAPQVAAESIVPQAVMPAATNVAAAAPDILGGTASELAGAYGYPTVAAPTVPAINAAQGVQTVTQVPVAASAYAPAESMGNALAQDQAAARAVGNKLAATGATDTLGAGLKAATASPGAAWEFAKANAYPLGALGIAALSGMDDKKGTPGLPDPGMIRPYTYSRTKVPGAFDRTESGPMSSRERQYFNDQYTALTPYKAPGPEYALAAAEGGIVPFASGGPVEAMSDANAIGMNTGYPQADIRTGAYATPFQQPISRNVVTGAQDAAVNPYTGQAQFADGGSVGGYTFDPRTGIYTKPSGEGATLVSPTGDISGASGRSGGSGDSYSPSGPPPTTTPEEFEAQSARNQQINDFLTSIAKNSFTNMVFSGLNTLFGSQAPAPVSNAGTYAEAYPTSAQSGIGNPGESEPSTTSSQSGVGNPVEQGGNTSSDTGVGNPGESAANEARGGLNFNGKYYPPKYAQGGISNLGSYSDGGRLLRGPGDGVSDDIPAMIGQKQQARLADGEFVVPARIVSELGNGSTEAGARQLYAMMDRVQKARKKTVGKDKVATNSRAHKLLPA